MLRNWGQRVNVIVLFFVLISGSLSTEAQEPVWDDLMSMAWEAQQRGDRETEAKYLEEAVASAENTFGPEDARLALTLNSLATSLFVQGRLVDAEAPALRAWQISKKVYGEKHLDTIMYKGMLGETYLQQGRLSEAERIFTENISTLQDLFTESLSSTLLDGPNRNQQIEIALGTVYGGLGRLYGARRKYTRAEENFRRALELLTASLGSTHPLVAATRYSYEEVCGRPPTSALPCGSP